MAISPQIFKNCHKTKTKYSQKNTNLRTHTEHPEAGAAGNFRRLPVLSENVAPHGHTPVNFAFSKKNSKKSYFTTILRHPKNGISKTQAKSRRRQPRNPIFLGIFPFPEPDRPRNPIPSTRHKNWILEPNRARDVQKQPQSQKASKKTRKFLQTTIFAKNNVNTPNPYFRSAKIDVDKILALGWSNYWRETGVNVVKLLAPEHIYIYINRDEWWRYSHGQSCLPRTTGIPRPTPRPGHGKTTTPAPPRTAGIPQPPPPLHLQISSPPFMGGGGRGIPVALGNIRPWEYHDPGPLI